MLRFFKSIGKSLAAAALCLLLVCTAVAPAFAAEEHAPLQIGIISDIHYFSEHNMGGPCEAFLRFEATNANERYESQGLLNSALTALATHARENDMKYVLIPGDLTANGEYWNHMELAEKLEAFEQETGMPVIVTNGNHDINNYGGFTFENGVREKARITTPEEFREIYKNLGFDLAYHTFTPSSGKAGMLSYSVRLDGGYRLIVLDVNKYSADATTSGKDSHQTDGAITDELFQWALDEIEDAERCGETPIGMEHHGIVAHFNIQPSIFKAFLIDDWQERAEALADAGLHFMLTGHMHDASITDWTSDNGNVLYDVSTASLTGFPNTFREIRFDNTGDTPTADVQTFDVDCVLPVTAGDTTFPQPYRESFSFQKTFSGDGLADLALRYLNGPLDQFFGAMEKDGSVIGALKTAFGLDVESIVSQYVNVHLGKIDIFTSVNVMSFLDDLDNQLRSEVLTSREDTETLVRTLIQKLLNFKVSDLPCTRFIEKYGFGSETGPTTFEVAAYNAVAILYEANQSIEDDVFMQDVLDFFRNRGGADALVEKLYDVLMHDLLQDTILGKLEFHIDALFPSGTLGHLGAAMLDNFFTLVFRGDKSFENIINSLLGLGLVPDYNSIDTMADYFMGAYLTDSAMEAMGETMADMVEDLVTDHGDGEDLKRFLTTEPREVTATRENGRLPSLLTVTVGKDAGTQRNISWYTKFSVTGSDIEIVPYSDTPGFSGTPTTRGVTASAERLDRSYPAVDFGFAGFMDTKLPLMRHTVQVTGLEPGKRYSYRVGDAEKGWWSDAGVFETAKGDTLSFLHVADAQSFNTTQYTRFANVLRTAKSMYPDANMILSSGNEVYRGGNVRQWQAFTDTASDVLLRTPFMPAAGTSESSGGVMEQNFLLTDTPEQNTENGTYYDFDNANAHFIVLNTNDVTDKQGLSAEQIRFLRESAGSTDKTWKIVLLHKSVYSSGAHADDKDVAALRRQFRTLLPSLGIDMVFEGQDRIYVRTGALLGGLPLKTGIEQVTYNGRSYTKQLVNRGTYYVLSGAAGAVPAGILGKAGAALIGAVREQPQYPVFSAVQISGPTLYFDAYTVDENGNTERIDSFALDKSKTSCSAKTEAPVSEPVLLDADDIDTIPMVVAMNEFMEMDWEVEDPVYPTNKAGEAFNPASVTTTKPSDTATTTGAAKTDDNTGSGSSSNDTGSGTNNSSADTASDTAGKSDGSGTNNASDNGTGSNSGSSNTASGNTGSSGAAQSGNTADTLSGFSVAGSAQSSSGTAAVLSGSNGTVGSAESAGSAGQTAGSASGSTGSGNTSSGNSVPGSSGGIPLLGGSAPVWTSCILFGAMVVAMATRKKKKE